MIRIALRNSLLGLALMVLLQLTIGCEQIRKTPQPAVKALSKIRFFLPSFSDDLNFEGLTECIDLSIAYLEARPSEQTFQFGQDVYSRDHIINSLSRFRDYIEQRPPPEKLKQFIRSNYRVYQSTGLDRSREVLFTGYYEPVIAGSLKQTEGYRYPIFARPDDLLTIDLSLFSSRYKGQKILGRFDGNTVLPYFDRKAIDQDRALKEHGRPLAWTDDPVGLFFLHVQGSGKVQLEDGRSIHIHYHTSNGRPYKSIGRLLIDTGRIEKSEMSMQKIRTYLKEHPEEIEEVLYYNPSYVFFKTETEGPVGYLGSRLTAGRSLAVDRRIFPLPSITFIKAKKPVLADGGEIETWIDFDRFLVSQDTGGAIRGPGRADIFWGNGPYAEIAAGHLQHKGVLYFLVLKPDR